MTMDPVPGVEYPLLLGNTVLANDEPYTYVSMRYDFKPASAIGQHASGVYSRRDEQVAAIPPPLLRTSSYLPLQTSSHLSFHPAPQVGRSTCLVQPIHAGDVPATQRASWRRSEDFHRPL